MPLIRGMADIITSFRELIVWQKSMDLAVRAYNTAKKLPSEDRMLLLASGLGLDSPEA